MNSIDIIELRRSIDKLTSAATAMIECMGMQAENQSRACSGKSIAYGEESFRKIIEKHYLQGI